MNEVHEPEDRPPALHCLQGKLPPTQILQGWRVLLGFPRGALDNFWSLIETALNDPENPQNQSLLETYAQRFGVQPLKLLAAIQACDFLLRQAAVVNLTAERFTEDLEALSGDNPVGRDLLMERFVAVKDHLRRRILEDTLADHGRVLVGMDWRVDRLEASHRGTELDTSVLFLTLRYRDAEGQHRLSVQLTPEALGSLRLLFEQFAG